MGSPGSSGVSNFAAPLRVIATLSMAFLVVAIVIAALVMEVSGDMGEDRVDVDVDDRRELDINLAA